MCLKVRVCKTFSIVSTISFSKNVKKNSKTVFLYPNLKYQP